MHSSTKLVAALVAAVVLGAGWAGFAQVRDKSKDKPGTPAKQAPADSKAATGQARPPAEAARPGTSAAKDAKQAPAADKPGDDAESADEAAIRKGAEAFVTAYNAHNAKAVSELFALKAEFTDEDGNLIKGREAIEKDFAEMFTENPECKIAVEIDTIRVLTPNIAVEEGIVRGRPVPEGEENVSSYVAVHVKVDGKWLTASVSHYEADPEDLTARDHLQELAWMAGDWIDESPDSVVKSSCRWDDSGNYLLHDFVLQIGGELNASGSLRIGWDPLSGQLKSWTFDADSSYSEGLWTRVGKEWSVKSHGVNSEGQVTFATHVFRHVDDDTMTWRSYDRIVGGKPEDDIPEFIIKRQAPPPAN